MTYQFSALTNGNLEDILSTLDRLDALEALLVDQHVIDGEECELTELADAALEELTRRAMDDAGYKVNRMVANGELDRYVRPDGRIGYAPPGAWDEAQS